MCGSIYPQSFFEASFCCAKVLPLFVLQMHRASLMLYPFENRHSFGASIFSVLPYPIQQRHFPMRNIASLSKKAAGKNKLKV